jgi:hypothetical protein
MQDRSSIDRESRDAIRELTLEEIDQISGANGTPQVTPVGQVQGATQYKATCGDGYSIAALYNPNVAQTADTVLSQANYRCDPHSYGIKTYYIYVGSGSYMPWMTTKDEYN